MSKHYEAAEVTGTLYEQEADTQGPNSTAAHHNTKPLLLDAVITPLTKESPSEINHHRLVLEAKKERDNALLTTKLWRNTAERIKEEKR